MEKYNTEQFSPLARSTFDLRSFDFYSQLSPPPFLFKVEGVQAVLCGDRESHQRPARYRRIGTNSTLWHKKAAKWDHIDTLQPKLWSAF